MGKSEEKQTKKRAQKATDGESKHKIQTSFATFGSNSPFEIKDTDAELRRHSQWCDRFRELCEYKVQFGHCRVPQLYSVNRKLGYWVADQRYRYKKNTGEKSTVLTAEHTRALDGIGFDWGTRKADFLPSWNERLQQLRDYKVLFGHCLVPQQYAYNQELGHWVSNQRKYYNSHQKGRKSPMTAELIRALESVGFEWKTSAAVWNERIAQLREFKEQFGHCLVPNKYPSNLKLGLWVTTQRTTYKYYQQGKPCSMTAERIRELESVGFKWARNYVFRSEQSVA